MTTQLLLREIINKKSFLCIGLDTDINKIPQHLLQHEDPVFEFNRQIIDATHDMCVAYKPNIAFYESLGTKGWNSLEKTLAHIPENIFTIADAKRGDIGNTSGMYAKAFFEILGFDAITINPYMGQDSVLPFLEYKDRCIILLALTSNKGSEDFQMMEQDGEKLFEKVIKKSQQWGTAENILFVVGATQAVHLKKIRSIAPDNFLLIPGVGVQGGSLEEVMQYGMNKKCGLLINSSRSIIYAGSGEDFAQKAKEEAVKIQQQMEKYLILNNII